MSLKDHFIVPPGFDDDLPSSDGEEEPGAIPRKSLRRIKVQRSNGLQMKFFKDRKI